MVRGEQEDVPARAFAALDMLCADLPAEAPLGVAVSGGGDSIALLHLATRWPGRGARPLIALTVDHGLRATEEVAREIALVGEAARALGLDHEVLKWRGWQGKGNLQAAAREARYRLLADRAQALGASAVLLGHTEDDQAETLLMRLARGGGVSGLGAMAPRSRRGGMVWLRPLLGISRADLRVWAKAAGVKWAEDPSNEDEGFERIRLRKALVDLERVGLTRRALARTAERMRRADEALEHATDDLARSTLSLTPGGSVRLAGPVFHEAPEELQLRLLMRVLRRIGQLPRQREGERALACVLAGEKVTVGGCLVLPMKAEIRIVREWSRAEGLGTAPGLWDRRWEIFPAGEGRDAREADERPKVAETSAATTGPVIRVLGPAGLEMIRRELAASGERFALPEGLLEPELLASPALFDTAGHLLAAPLARFSQPEGSVWQARLRIAADDFVNANLSH